MLSLEDFKIDRQVFEAKYPPNYLLWDRSGEMWATIARDFDGLKLVSAVPNTTQFESASFYLVVEQEVLRITSKDDTPTEKLIENAQSFFKVVVRFLEIELFTRLGLRTIWGKRFGTLTEVREAIKDFQMVRDFRAEEFGLKPNPPGVDLKITSEDKENGITIGLRTEKRHMEPQIPWEFQSDYDWTPKDRFALVVDVDYFTVSQVRKDQLDAEEWIGSSLRRIKKGLAKEIFR